MRTTAFRSHRLTPALCPAQKQNNLPPELDTPSGKGRKSRTSGVHESGMKALEKMQMGAGDV